jgi:hypothetical protein
MIIPPPARKTSQLLGASHGLCTQGKVRIVKGDEVPEHNVVPLHLPLEAKPVVLVRSQRINRKVMCHRIHGAHCGSWFPRALRAGVPADFGKDRAREMAGQMAAAVAGYLARLNDVF